MEEGRYFYSKEEYQEYLDKEYNTKMNESQSYDRFKPNPLSGNIPSKCIGCIHCIQASLHWVICYAPGRICRPSYTEWIHK